jgi:uridine kinase
VSASLIAKTAAKAFMIAITGGSGSGKTTLARALRDRLGEASCALVTEDNYYLPRARHTPDVTGWANEKIEQTINFDNPASKDMALFRTHILALSQRQGADQPVYDFAIHDRLAGAVNHVEPRPVIVCEGLHVLSDPGFAPLFDLTVFVDTSDDLRLIRRIRRDRTERGRASEGVILQYLRFVRESHHRYTQPAKYLCDLVVADEGHPAFQNDMPNEAAVERLIAPVWARLETMGVVAKP